VHELHRQFREHAIRSVTLVDPGGVVPIQLSGGVDSATLLAVQLARGVKPVCYTWMVEGIESEDMQAARLMTKQYGVEHHEVVIPRNLETLVQDIRKILGAVAGREDLILNTSIQCAHPALYMTPAMVRDGHMASMWGLGAGDFYPDGQEEQKVLRYEGKAELDRIMKFVYLDHPEEYLDSGSNKSCELVAAAWGHVHLFPYLDKDWWRYMIPLPKELVNRPVWKGIAVMAFPEFWGGRPWYRKNASYQIISGLKQYHQTLLASKYNTRGSRNTVAIYRDLAREVYAAAPA
jgi:asparagine synthetase B (glutamine-hydrolysing)